MKKTVTFSTNDKEDTYTVTTCCGFEMVLSFPKGTSESLVWNTIESMTFPVSSTMCIDSLYDTFSTNSSLFSLAPYWSVIQTLIEKQNWIGLAQLGFGLFQMNVVSQDLFNQVSSILVDCGAPNLLSLLTEEEQNQVVNNPNNFVDI
jgi:hypothetical protein